jgi:hypothetical protein
MRSPVSPDLLTDLEVADLTFGSKNWDRRRSSETRRSTIAFLEHAANHLIADQMGAGRVYWPGAIDAVRILREAISEVRSEKQLDERAARVAASWLPKYTLARNARRGDSDA